MSANVTSGPYGDFDVSSKIVFVGLAIGLAVTGAGLLF